MRLGLEGGRPIATVAAELGISATTLGNWVAHERQSTLSGALGESERAELRRLRKEVKEITAGASRRHARAADHDRPHTPRYAAWRALRPQ